LIAPAWLRERCRSGPFTTRGLAAELLARGIKTDRRARLVFVRAEGLSLKKTVRPACRFSSKPTSRR